MVHAQVIVEHQLVVMKRLCDVHGTYKTILCSDVPFFKKLLKANKNKHAQDIEDLDALQNKRSNRPLFLEVDVFEQDDVIPEEEIISRLKLLLSNSDESYEYIYKINGGPIRTKAGLVSFNDLLLRIEKRIPAGPILVELPFDRLADVCLLDNSALIKGRLYPCVRYFLKKGDELLFVEEMTHLLNALSVFEGIKLTITLSMDNPFPDLGQVFALLKSHRKFIRCLVLSPQKSMRRILSELTDSQDSDDRDLMEVFRCIEAGSGGQLKHTGKTIVLCVGALMIVLDFFPLSYLDGLLDVFGYGRLSLSASPFCVLMSVLDMVGGGLFDECGRILMSRALSVGVDAQVLLVHNNMDLSSVDIGRRAQCCQIKGSILDEGHISSACLGCL
jgi:hypothetical protein